MRILLLLLSFALPILAADTSPPYFLDRDPPPAPLNEVPGRFTLLSATYVNKDDKVVPVVIRIDTATGETWSLVEVPIVISGPPSKLPLTYTGWYPLFENALLKAGLTQQFFATNKPPQAPKPPLRP
jgi:hypothetical protein